MSNAPPQYYPEAGYPPPQPYPSSYPQQYPPEGYPPAPAPVVQQQQSSNVVVVQQSQPQVVQQNVYQTRDSPNHLLHCIITFFCPWYLLIWLCICCIYGC